MLPVVSKLCAFCAHPWRFSGARPLGPVSLFLCAPRPSSPSLGCRGYFDPRCQLPATVSELAVTAAPLLVSSTTAAQGGPRAGCPPLTAVGEGGCLGGWVGPAATSTQTPFSLAADRVVTLRSAGWVSFFLACKRDRCSGSAAVSCLVLPAGSDVWRVACIQLQNRSQARDAVIMAQRNQAISGRW